MSMIIDPQRNPEMENAPHQLINLTWEKLKKLKRTSGNVRDKAASNFGALETMLLDGPVSGVRNYEEVAKRHIALHDEYTTYLNELYDFERGFLTWIKMTQGEEEAKNMLNKLMALKGRNNG